jgi:hypothetical protein
MKCWSWEITNTPPVKFFNAVENAVGGDTRNGGEEGAGKKSHRKKEGASKRTGGEGFDGTHVQVVRGLVQNHHVGLLVRQARETDAAFLTAGNKFHGFEGVVAGHFVPTEVCAQLCHVGKEA